MASLYLNRISNEDRQGLVQRLHQTQHGSCFICGHAVDLQLHTFDIDHIEPITAGGKDSPENFALTHDSCNRSKQASNLRVARVLASFDALAKGITDQDRSPNLGDLLRQYDGSKYDLPVTVDGSVLRTSFPDIGQNNVIHLPIYDDELSGFRAAFVNLPIEYLHHDDQINPRAIGRNLRKLVIEFHKKLPQLHVSLGLIETSNGNRSRVRIFDGQHKAAAQILLGARTLPVRVFIDPDTDLLLTANTNAGTTLRQVAFDKFVQRSLGSSILSNRIDRYRVERGLAEDDESFSERDLVNHFKGEAREMRKYILDRVRDGIATHPENRLRHYIEQSGRSAEKPLSYITIERTFFQFFINREPLTTAFNYRFQEGTNPRQLEIEQIVKLLNIIADKIYIDQFDLERGARRIENDVQKGKDVAEPHLRAFRISKEEIVHNWVRLIRQIIYNYFVMTGEFTDETRLFQQKIPEACWRHIENFINSLIRLPLWFNRDLSVSTFGTKHNNEYWLAVFKDGSTPDGVPILHEGINILEMIKDGVTLQDP